MTSITLTHYKYIKIIFQFIRACIICSLISTHRIIKIHKHIINDVFYWFISKSYHALNVGTQITHKYENKCIQNYNYFVSLFKFSIINSLISITKNDLNAQIYFECCHLFVYITINVFSHLYDINRVEKLT
jgi:hypothetical protein